MAYSWDNRVDFVVRYMYGKLSSARRLHYTYIYVCMYVVYVSHIPHPHGVLKGLRAELKLLKGELKNINES